MKNWKKGIIVLASLVGLAACTGTNPGTKEEQTTEEKSSARVVASIYPLYDWARTLAEGTSIEADYLVDHGDLHAYSPSADDIVKAKAAKLVLAIGGEDEKLTKLDGVNALVMTDVVKDALLASEHHHDHDHEDEECCDEHEDEDHDHDHDHEDVDHDHEGEEHHHHHHHHAFDEHVWLSPALAKRMVSTIADEMIKISPDDRAVIEKNRDDYLKKLGELEKEYEEFGKTKPTLVFADRFPFHYLEQAYGWNVVAAYRGCSADAEVSVETMAKLIDQAKEKTSILAEVRGDGKIAKTVVEGSKAKVVHFNTMEAVSRDENASYIEIMRENLKSFQEAAK